MPAPSRRKSDGVHVCVRYDKSGIPSIRRTCAHLRSHARMLNPARGVTLLIRAQLKCLRRQRCASVSTPDTGPVPAPLTPLVAHRPEHRVRTPPTESPAPGTARPHRSRIHLSVTWVTDAQFRAPTASPMDSRRMRCLTIVGKVIRSRDETPEREPLIRSNASRSEGWRGGCPTLDETA